MTVTIRATIKVTDRSTGEKLNTVGSCIIMNGITERTMILAISFVSLSIVIPNPSKNQEKQNSDTSQNNKGNARHEVITNEKSET